MGIPDADVRRVVLIGPPASGKGTQARRLAKALGLSYLSTGALLREHMAQGTEIGRLAGPILQQGGYLPDDCMCAMVEEWLGQRDSGWVLDGFPRSLQQAAFLGCWLDERGLTLDAAVALEAPLEALEGRILGRVECPNCRWSGGVAELSHDRCPECGALTEAREDDTLDNFRNRHQAYLESARPLVDLYRARGELCACDATGTRDEVAASLLRQLGIAPVAGH